MIIANIRAHQERRHSSAAFFKHGYRFCVRYVRRANRHAYDLTHGEAAGLLDAGIGLMIVQHVAPEGWTPTVKDGASYGSTAAAESTNVGVPPGVMVWCDLEGVAPTAPAQQVIDFCNAWHSAVAAAGFVPGLYVGFGAGLSPTQLYRDLRFTHYWSAYNLNADQYPAIRGVQMRQAERRPLTKCRAIRSTFRPTPWARTNSVAAQRCLRARAGSTESAMLATIHLYGTKHMTHHSEAATKKARLCLVVGLACIASLAGAQSPHRLDVTAVGSDPHWKVAGRTTSVVDVKGKHALRLSEGPSMGVVWLDGYDFGNGVIEADLLGRSQPVQGSFIGVFQAVQLSRSRCSAAQSRGAVRVQSELALAKAAIRAPGHV